MYSNVEKVKREGLARGEEWKKSIRQRMRREMIMHVYKLTYPAHLSGHDRKLIFAEDYTRNNCLSYVMKNGGQFYLIR